MADQTTEELKIDLELLVKEAKSAEDFRQTKEEKNTRVGGIILDIYPPKSSANYLKIYGSEKDSGIAWQLHFAPGGNIGIPADEATKFKNARILRDNMKQLALLSEDEVKGFKNSKPDLIFGLTPNKPFADMLTRLGFSIAKKNDNFLVVNKTPEQLWKFAEKRTTREIFIPTKNP